MKPRISRALLCLVVSITYFQEQISAELPSTQQQFQHLLDATARTFRIQNVQSGKFLTSVNMNHNGDYTKDSLDVFSLGYQKENQVWTVQKAVGFPFRNGSFTPVHKIRPADGSFAKSVFSESVWKLTEVGHDAFRISNPYRQENCLTGYDIEGSSVLNQECEDDDDRSLWKFIPTSSRTLL